MYSLRPMPSAIPASTLDRLSAVETATVGHFRLTGFMDLAIRPLLPGTAVGTAVTVRTHGPDSAAIVAALDLLRPGDMLVIDRSGEDRFACFGAVMGAAARQRGAAGVIIDGKACDFPDLRALHLPLWCTGASPLLSKRLGLDGAINTPIVCGGVSVNPGDAILADESGILVIDLADISNVADQALVRQDKEQDILARVARGEPLFEILGLPAPADVCTGTLRR